MDFISQYLMANSGTVVPRRYTMWSAISILGMTLGRKVFIDEQHFIVYPGIYICLVGDPASRKSTAMVQARDMFTSCFPDYPTGVSVTSREDIVKFLSSDQCMRSFDDGKGNLVEWRPLANFINELSNFMSFNPKGMIEFLTDIYDSKFFISSTVKRGKEEIINPHVSILACTVPNYIIDTFKSNIIGGGFSRRILFIYETEIPAKQTFPTKSPEAFAAETWCKEHLKKVWTLAGEFKWTDEARTTLDTWYKQVPSMRDSVLAGYYESKDIIVRKLAMCLAAAEPEPTLILTANLITNTIAFLESIEDNLPKLSIASGRNELAIYHHRLVQLLEDRGGWLPEKLWHRIASAELSEMEYFNVRKLLRETSQLYEISHENAIYMVHPLALKKFVDTFKIPGLC